MKHLLWIYCLFALVVRGAVPGTTEVSTPVAPSQTNSNYGATDTRYGKGGFGTWATSLDKLSDPNWLPNGRKEAGMVNVVGGVMYQLQPDLTTWTPILAGPAQGIANNITELTTSTALGNLSTIELLGRSAPGDGGGGMFYYDATDTTSAQDGGMIFVHTNGKRFKRLWGGGPINTVWFGANPASVSDQTAIIQAAINFAELPSYGPVNVPLKTGAGVYTPSGQYYVTQLKMTNTTEFFGDPPNIAKIDSGTTFIQVTPFIGDMVQLYGNTYLHHFRLWGRSEQNTGPKVAITAVANRTNFTVAVASLPADNAAKTTYPFYGHCFFYDSRDYYLGSGFVGDIDRAAGNIKLIPGTDFYATVTGAGTNLTTTCKVIFTPLNTVNSVLSGPKTGYFSALAPNGNTGIALKSGGYTKMLSVRIQMFHVGILTYPDCVIWANDLEVLSNKLANYASVYPGSIYDGYFHQSIFIGNYSRNGLPGGNAGGPTDLDNNLFRRCLYSIMWPGSTDMYSEMVLSSSLIGAVQSGVLTVMWKPFFADSALVGGLLVEGPDFGQIIADVDQFLVRPDFVVTGAEYAQPTSNGASTYGLKITSNFNSLGIGDFLAHKLGPVYAGTSIPTPALTNLFDLVNGSNVKVGNLAFYSMNSVLQFKEPGSRSPFMGNRYSGIENATDAQVNWYYPTSGGTFYAFGGAKQVEIQSSGVTLGNVDLTTPGLTVEGGGAGSPMLRLKRTVGSTQNFDFGVGADLFRIINQTRGHDSLTINDQASVNLIYLGNSGLNVTPKSAFIQGEFGGGTDGAAASVTLSAGAATGAGRPGRVNLSQSVKTTSGTAVQTVVPRLLVDTNGAVSISQTSSGAADAPLDTAFQVLSTTTGSRPFPRMNTANRLAIVPTAFLGLFVYDDTFFSLFQLRGSTTNTWRTMSPLMLPDQGDADVTLNPWQSGFTAPFATALTANRTVTLGGSGALPGDEITIVRTGGGAFTLTVTGVKTIPASIPATIVAQYDGGVWRLKSYTIHTDAARLSHLEAHSTTVQNLSTVPTALTFPTQDFLDGAGLVLAGTDTINVTQNGFVQMTVQGQLKNLVNNNVTALWLVTNGVPVAGSTVVFRPGNANTQESTTMNKIVPVELGTIIQVFAATSAAAGAQLETFTLGPAPTTPSLSLTVRLVTP